MAGREVTQKASFHSLKADELLVGSSGDAMKTFETATETLTMTGAVSGTAVVLLTRIGDVVTMRTPAALSGGFANAVLTLTAVSANFRPVVTHTLPVFTTDVDDGPEWGRLSINSSGVITITPADGLAFSEGAGAVDVTSVSWYAATL
jgi:hypothetical protein